MKAKKLPSGNWRVRLYIGKEDGRPKYKSFTASTKKEAEFAAAQYSQQKRHEADPQNITLSQAYDRYIESKDAILSPSTIRNYGHYKENSFQELMGKKLKDITQEDVQRSLNTFAKTHSPKSCRNVHGLLAAVLGEYAPDFRLSTALPAPQKKEMYIPTQDEIKRIFEAVKDTEMEIPVLLAACLGLRRSEICGLRWSAYNGKQIEIKEAIVQNAENEWVSKSPKTFAGRRTLDVPQFIAAKINAVPKTSPYIVTLTEDIISKRFRSLLKREGINHFRFHDLRHYNASVMLALGVPNKYAANRMGHSTDHMLKRVYQHLMQDKEQEVAQAVNGFFEKIGEI